MRLGEGLAKSATICAFALSHALSETSPALSGSAQPKKLPKALEGFDEAWWDSAS
jgi:hypothetical protein